MERKKRERPNDHKTLKIAENQLGKRSDAKGEDDHKVP
jgi:hypothetical protein